MENKNVRFIRRNGRVIPIRVKEGNKKTLSTAALVGGSAVALDAARTKRIYSKDGITIDRKKFTYQPFVHDRLGTTVVMKKNGQKIGTASFFRGAGDDWSVKSLTKSRSFGFSWIGVKKPFRGEGYSKILSKEAVKDIRRQGGTELFNQVIHKGSLKTNYSSKRDTLYKITDKQYRKINLKQALSNISYYRSKKGELTSDVFRQTSLRNIRKPKNLPFRTKWNKRSIALGIGVASLGAAGLMGE